MKKKRLAFCLAMLFASVAPALAGSAYYRFPALHQDTLIFTAEGDLWSAAASGGEARRLTSHAAEETRAAISPDGRWIAFSAAYEGPVEVYVMPTAGGKPQRVSFEGSRAFAIGWTAQGEVLYSSFAATGPASQRMVAAVDPKTLAKRVFPLADANDAALSEDGKTLYFVRFGLTETRDNVRAYRGGALSQLWRYELGGAEAQRIGPTDANLRRPMLWQGKLYVVCDRDGHDKLWEFSLDGQPIRALTDNRDFEVRSASLDAGRIAYQLGADLHLLDIASGADRVVSPELVSDFDQTRARWLEHPQRYMTTALLSPDGGSVAVTARGHAVLAGVGPRRRVELNQPAASRLAFAVASADGHWVYAICDASGEQEIWRFPSDGGEGKALTHDGSVQRRHLFPSPDGKWIAHDDLRGRLWLLDVATGANRLIDDGGKYGSDGYDFVRWSPDGRAIALARPNSALLRSQIGLYSLEQAKTQWLSSDKYESGSPAFSPDGRWLYFLSDRSFKVGGNPSPWGDRNMGPSFERRTRIYALALQAGNRFPFAAPDELSGPVAADKSGDGKDSGKEGKDAKAKLPSIEWAGLASRLFEVPLPASDYENLALDAQRLYFLDKSEDSRALKTLKIGFAHEYKPEVFAPKVSNFALDAKGKKLLFLRPAGANIEMYVVDAGAKAPAELAPNALRLGDWALRVEPREEWRQMFNDAWRLHRDHFYDPALRGIDWRATKKKYEALLSRVNDRNELDDLLGQMNAELAALHSQIIPGDVRPAREVAAPAGLGAVLESGDQGWRVAHIYRTEAELPNERSPLEAPGVDVREGDWILSVNSRSTRGVRDIAELLAHQAGQQVLLEVKRGGEPVRKLVVTPVSAAQQTTLRYGDWEIARREIVDKISGGRFGYLHLRAMGAGDIASFAREFYAQFDREGLIIDVRRNNGGNIDSWIIEKLLRRAWAFWSPRGAQPYTNMQQTFRGRLVVLTDALTYSDGETFSAGIKALGLGPLIGTRTAGAGVWLSDSTGLVDNGRARVAEHAQFLVEGGKWAVEGVGVVPDIEVDNLPHASYQGQDAQLEAAIANLRRQLAEKPVPVLKPQGIPPVAR
jgi:tricorn protease